MRSGTTLSRLFLAAALIAAALAIPALTVTRSAQAEYPHVRFAHLSAGGDPVDVFLDEQRIVEALAFGQASAYWPMGDVSAVVAIVPAGGAESDRLLTTPLAFAVGDSGYYTVALVAGGDSLLAITLPSDGAPAASGQASIGELSISGAYVRATAVDSAMAMGDEHMHGQHGSMANDSVTAAYMTIQNGAGADDRLITVSADAAATVEIHETIVENDVARMQMLPGGLEIPAGGSAELKPGGLHLMLIGLAHPLTPGQAVMLTLTFESGAVAVVRAPVRMP